MGITANFNPNEIDDVFRELLEEVERQTIETLQHVGEEAVKLSRLPHAKDWRDDTGNLRSSVGYTIFKDGTPLKANFQAVGGGSEGIAQGEKLAAQVGGKTQGYALVVVAGMKYAVYVESKGRDVLTGAEAYAKQQIARELADMITNIKNAFK